MPLIILNLVSIRILNLKNPWEGSHDEFTYYMDKSAPWGPDATELQDLFGDLDIAQDIAKGMNNLGQALEPNMVPS